MEYEVLFFIWYDYHRGDRLTCVTTESKDATEIIRQSDSGYVVGARYE